MGGGGARCVVCALFAALLSFTAISAKADTLTAMSEKEFLSYYYQQTGEEVMLARSLDVGWVQQNKDTLYSQLENSTTTRDRLPRYAANFDLSSKSGRNRNYDGTNGVAYVSGYDDDRVWWSLRRDVGADPYAPHSVDADGNLVHHSNAAWNSTKWTQYTGSMSSLKLTLTDYDGANGSKTEVSLGGSVASKFTSVPHLSEYFGGKDLTWFAVDLRGFDAVTGASNLTITGGTAGFGNDTFDMKSLVFGQLNFFAIDATQMPAGSATAAGSTLTFNLGNIKIANANYEFFGVQVGTLQAATWEYSVLNPDSIYFDAGLVPEPTETPEPATMLILGLGLAGLGLARRKK